LLFLALAGYDQSGVANNKILIPRLKLKVGDLEGICGEMNFRIEGESQMSFPGAIGQGLHCCQATISIFHETL